jgi:hypothetical protein
MYDQPRGVAPSAIHPGTDKRTRGDPVDIQRADTENGADDYHRPAEPGR